jgi:hypothetical protein
MERTREEELGLDAMVGNSARVSATAFRSRSMHLWVDNGTLPPSSSGGYGYGPFLGLVAQDAEMINSGLETSITMPLLDVSRVRWTGALSLALLHNRISRLVGPAVISANSRLEQGYPLGAVWAIPYSYADSNKDGLIGTNEVLIGQPRYMGPPLPTFEAAFDTELELPAHISITGTLDYRGGNRVVNFTEAERCHFGICRAAQDPSTPLDEQAGAVAAVGGGPSVTAYAQDATFLRVREVAVHWTMPSSWSRYIGLTPTITIAGRNVATWTKYRGFDPEVSYLRPDALPRQEFLIPPLPRVLVMRLDLDQRFR